MCDEPRNTLPWLPLVISPVQSSGWSPTIGMSPNLERPNDMCVNVDDHFVCANHTTSNIIKSHTHTHATTWGYWWRGIKFITHDQMSSLLSTTIFTWLHVNTPLRNTSDDTGVVPGLRGGRSGARGEDLRRQFGGGEEGEGRGQGIYQRCGWLRMVAKSDQHR